MSASKADAEGEKGYSTKESMYGKDRLQVTSRVKTSRERMRKSPLTFTQPLQRIEKIVLEMDPSRVKHSMKYQENVY